MVGWSFAIGRIFGVEVRLHSFFVVLLFLSMTWSGYLGRPLLRGVALWVLVLLAIAVRETARALAAAWFSLDLRNILLLPTGGLFSYASPEALARAGEPEIGRWMALVGPLSNILFGLAVAGLALSVSPHVDLVGMPWVTPAHLLRTLVWINLVLAALNFLPAWPLDAGRVVRAEIVRAGGRTGVGPARLAGMRKVATIGPALAIGLIAYGVVSGNWWVIVLGIAILLAAQVERDGLLLEATGDQLRVKDVMLTEYSILSASATLEDAVDQARHTLQDVFPVVRAGNMVGAVARQNILAALAATGNGYVQGIMARTFETAAPDDPLVATLNRVTARAGVSSQLVPVVEDERIVGILTPANLQRTMGLLATKAQGDGRRAAEDETE